MAIKIWKGSELDIKYVGYKKSTGKTIYVTYAPTASTGISLDKFYISTPKLSYSLPVKYEKLRITLFLKTNSKFKIFLKHLDEYIPKIAFDNRKDWFDEDLVTNDQESFYKNYHKQIQSDKNTKLDCIRFNLPPDLEKTTFNEMNQLIDTKIGLDPFQELSFSQGQISLLLKCRGIWINQEAYGVSWDVVQLKIFRPADTLPKGSLILTTLDQVKAYQPKFNSTSIMQVLPNSKNDPEIGPVDEKIGSDIEGDEIIQKKEIVNYLIIDE